MGQTDGHPTVIDPAPHTTWAASITNQYITYTRQFIFLFIVLFFLNVRTFKRVNAYWVTQECCRWQGPWVCPMACALPWPRPGYGLALACEVGVVSCRHVRLFRPVGGRFSVSFVVGLGAYCRIETYFLSPAFCAFKRVDRRTRDLGREATE